MNVEGFVDSYNMSWTLDNGGGVRIHETFENIRLSDFEVIYGNNTMLIISIEMRVIGWKPTKSQ